jgi:hypothetical protein
MKKIPYNKEFFRKPREIGEKSKKRVHNLFKKYAESFSKILTFHTKKSMMDLPIFEEVNHS